MSIEFRSAAEAADRDPDAPIEFEDLVIKDAQGKHAQKFYFEPPSTTQIALYTASFGSNPTEMTAMGATMDFLKEVFEPESYDSLIARLKDRNDWLEFDDVPGLIRAIVESATARPTRPSSGSTSTQKPGGRRLTDHLPPQEQTRSRSTRSASAT